MTAANQPPPSDAPAATAQQPHAQIDMTATQRPHDPSAAAKLPHERDQSVDMTDAAAPPTPEMAQAHQDLQNGLVDTDARGADGKPLGSKQPPQ